MRWKRAGKKQEQEENRVEQRSQGNRMNRQWIQNKTAAEQQIPEE
jgi:hypothetical protein